MTKLYNGYILDGMNEFERNVKRGFDFIVSILCLVVFSPLFAYCYFRIKSDDGGPVIYKQERIGRFGRPFNIYKFRSMKVDAETNGPELCDSADDDRLTKAGRFLRAHHLDELPQFWNVFKGEMSFVGPRLNGSSSSTRLWSTTAAMSISTRYARAFPRSPRSTTAIPTRWRRC